MACTASAGMAGTWWPPWTACDSSSNPSRRTDGEETRSERVNETNNGAPLAWSSVPTCLLQCVHFFWLDRTARRAPAPFFFYFSHSIQISGDPEQLRPGAPHVARFDRLLPLPPLFPCFWIGRRGPALMILRRPSLSIIHSLLSQSSILV